MPKFQSNVTLSPYTINDTYRLADGTGDSNQLTRADNDKLLKLVADSRMGLCAAGDQIEGQVVVGDDITKQDGFSIGSVKTEKRMLVTLDGLQATPGTGTVAVGDYVVCGTVVARGTALSAPPKVCKATAAATALVFKWRVIAILKGGTGAVGDIAVIERV